MIRNYSGLSVYIKNGSLQGHHVPIDEAFAIEDSHGYEVYRLPEPESGVQVLVREIVGAVARSRDDLVTIPQNSRREPYLICEAIYHNGCIEYLKEVNLDD